MPEVGETVMVLLGQYRGNSATIESKTCKAAKLNVNGDTTGDIPLRQFVAKGDSVTSVRGKYEGHVGTISDITAESVKLLIDGTETGSVPWDSISKSDTCGTAEPKTPEKAVSKSGKSETADLKTPEKVAEPSKEKAPEESGYAKAAVPEAPDTVMILSGKYAGRMATIESKTGKTAKLNVNGDTTGDIPLRQFVDKGDTVKSISGKYEGKVGTVSNITAKSVQLLIDGTETGSVPWDSISKV